MKKNENLEYAITNLELAIDYFEHNIHDLIASNDYIANSNKELAEAIIELTNTLKEIKK